MFLKKSIIQQYTYWNGPEWLSSRYDMRMMIENINIGSDHTPRYTFRWLFK